MPVTRRRGQTQPGRNLAVVHFPDDIGPIIFVPEYVAGAVAIEIAGADHVPIGRSGRKAQLRSVRQPDRRLSIGALPQNIGFAAAVEGE